MQLHSTRNKDHTSTWRDAVLTGLAPDGGLYVPSTLPIVSSSERTQLATKTFPQLAEYLAALFMQDEIGADTLHSLCAGTWDFPLPLTQLGDNTFVLELFHGPTCAFKDFGARFMARLFRHFWGDNHTALTVLVATSGDTGSAVANAFFDISPNPRIRVAILYPRDKVSEVQRRQMTTLGYNVTAYEVAGSFDDCQALVKRALQDKQLLATRSLTSANSINIARLLPQMFYYAFASLQFPAHTPPVFIVPSGNLGNLTGALMAHLCGFSATQLIAACNANSTFPDYLRTGTFSPLPSKETISNAMDVGAPSNFYRINALLGASDESQILSPASLATRGITGYSISDEETRRAMRDYHRLYGYCLDPHTAVGAAALQHHSASNKVTAPRVLVATAHPAKFSATVEDTLGYRPTPPPQLATVLAKPEQITPLANNYADFVRLI
jgi:threonine synthase